MLGRHWGGAGRGWATRSGVILAVDGAPQVCNIPGKILFPQSKDGCPSLGGVGAVEVQNNGLQFVNFSSS